MQPLWRLTVALACAWIASLFYGEVLAFWIPRWTCSWPELHQEYGSTRAPPEKAVKVALIADPQLTDRTSYGIAGSLALRVTEFYSDIYMRRAFRSSVLGLDPDEIVVLGDQLDGGAYLSDLEWAECLKRFWHIFDQSQRGLKSRPRRKIPVHFLAGNHDVGYQEVLAKNPQVLERYRREFGKTDYTLKIGSVEFIFVNAQALDGSRTDPACNSSWSFVEQVASKTTFDTSNQPKLLLTHIPLYRPNDTLCRQEHTQSDRRNYLTEETSLRLLNLTKPTLVFSGHVHIQCKVLHSTDEGSYPEHTVGTFSWQQGNKYPSFMLLSVAPRASATTSVFVSESVCYLPAQVFIYAWYAVLIVISILALLFWPVQGVNFWPYIDDLCSALSSTTAAKEKDEDAEWEMVWDAEGAMHLVRKAHPQKASQQNDASERRGTAVLRAATKSKATEIVEIEPTSPATHYSLPSRGRIMSLRRRLIQTSAPLLVLLTLNFSLYMMLVTKDWT